MTKFILLLCSIVAAGFAETNTLTLERALELARENSPALWAASNQVNAAEQVVVASGLRENPSLRFEAEGIGGDLSFSGDDEYKVALNQKFKRGAKRRGERDVARKTVDMVRETGAEQELVLLTQVRSAFIDVFSQQEIDRVRSGQEELGRAFVGVAKKRHETGGGSELEVVQAELVLEEVILSQTCCFGDLKAAREKLASLIGVPEKEMARLSGDYYELDEIQTSTLPESYPALRRLNAEVDRVRARAALERAGDRGDITLEVGYKFKAAEDINTFVVGASVPLNLIRAGRAKQAASLLQAEALEAEREELRRRLQRELTVAAALYSGSKMEVELTRDKLIPKAEQVYALSKVGYAAGRFSWLDLIRAQQQLAEIRVRYIEALRDAHFAKAEVEKFITEEI